MRLIRALLFRCIVVGLAGFCASGSVLAQEVLRGALTYTPPQAGAAPVTLYRSSKALVIGIDAYTEKGWPPLRNAVRDSEAVAKALEAHGFEVTRHKNLKSDQLEPVLRDFFISQGADPEARLLLWFAGHGHTLNLPVEEGYLVPADAPSAEDSIGFRRKALAMRQFGYLMTQASAKHVLAVFDSCFSGTALDITRQAEITAPPEILLSAGGKSRQIISSGDRDQKVSDNGVFQKLFVDAISGAVPRIGRDGWVTGRELGIYLRGEMTALTARSASPQTPNVGYLNQAGFNRGDFVFGPRERVVARTAVVSAPPALNRGGMIEIVAREWGRLETTTDRAAIEAFRRQFGGDNPFYDQQAAARLAVLGELGLEQSAVSAKPAVPTPPPAPITPARRIAASRAVGPLTAAELSAELSALALPIAKASEPFKECESCPVMVAIPGGTFQMGLSQQEIEALVNERKSDWYKREGPQRTVTVKLLAVGKFEVTFAEWESCVKGGGCAANKVPNDYQLGRGTRPVIGVSWSDAKQYVLWLSKVTKQDYRLLTEAEWEYAARARTTTAFSFGISISAAHANYDSSFDKVVSTGKISSSRERGPLKVGALSANPFGLHDMHGNVWEWVEDCWIVNYNRAPVDGSARTTGCTSDNRRVVRGGSWDSTPVDVRSTTRTEYTPGFRGYSIGFRVARSLQ